MILETYRECLRDVFDLPALVELLAAIRRREITLVPVDAQSPSPFASTLLFSYVGNFIYDGDAPLAERRAQALVLDQAELRGLLGEAELRELFDADIIAAVERDLLWLREPSLRHADDVHDLLLLLGDLTLEELQARALEPATIPDILRDLQAARRVACAAFAAATETRYFAAEDAGKLRDALGIALPAGLPNTFLAPATHALREVLSRFARTHAPFTSSAPARRYGLGPGVVEGALAQLEDAGRVVRGEFLPNGREREWCDKNVLRQIKQRSLAKLRRAIEPAAPEAFARLGLAWQGAGEPSRSPDALERATEQLQGTPIAASVLLQEVLPARVRGFSAADLDSLLSTGELCWLGVEPHGASDGKIALYRTDKLALLAPSPTPAPGELQAKLRAELDQGGALFFTDLVRRVGGFPRDLLGALWDLVWAGEATNDTLAPLRSLQAQAKAPRGRPDPRARRSVMPGSEGRWSLVRRGNAGSLAEQRTARARLLLERHGIVSREIVNADGLGSFAELYPVLKAMEDAGKVRRGYFIAGLGGAQFALPGADERLRLPTEAKPPVVLAATDPANPYGAALPWPGAEPRPQRTPGALVVLQQGRLLAYLGKSDRALSLFLSDEEPARGQQLAALLTALKSVVSASQRRVLLIQTIDREDAQRSPHAPAFLASGFSSGASGLSLRRSALPLEDVEADDEE
jgi:ATP-dependent Lhr-like helicase